MLNVSSAFLSAVKQGSRTISAGIGYDDKALINKLTGGNFPSETGWGFTGLASHSASSNIETFTANVQYGGVTQAVTSAIGNKVYFRAIIKTDNLNTNLKLMDSTNYNTLYPSVTGSYTLISGIMTPALTASLTFKIQDDRASGWTPIYVKECSVIDLTAIYGAGNEPSKAYMDALFARVGWFNGTKNVPSQFLGDRIFNNVLANGNFVDTSSWTAGANTLSASANTLTLTGNGTQAYQYTYQSGFNIPTGNKVYARVKAKATNALCTRFMLYCNAGYTGYQFANQNTPVNGTQYTMSGVITALANLTQFNLIGYYNTTTDATNSVIQLQEFMVIDLTALYGAGNEPTQAYMDSLIASTGWFKSEPLLEDASVLCDFNIDSALGNGNLPSIGATIANKFTVNLLNDKVIPQTIIGKTLRPYVGVQLLNKTVGRNLATGTYVNGVTPAFTNITNQTGYWYKAYFNTLASTDTVTMSFDVTYSGLTYSDAVNKKFVIQGSCDVTGWTTTLTGRDLTPSIDWTTGSGTIRVSFSQPMSSTLLTNSYWNVGWRADYLTGGTVTISNYKFEKGAVNTPWTNAYEDCTYVDTNGYEWVQLGEFMADYDGVDIGKLQTTIEAFDDMAYFMETTYVPMAGLTMTVQGVMNDLSANYGIRFATQVGLPTSTALKVVPTGSVRQVLSQMASLMSTNATMNYDGCVEFVFFNTIASGTFSMGLDNYSDFKLQPDTNISFTELILTDGTNEIAVGNSSGYALSFQNQQVVLDADVQTVYNRIFPINYYAYTMKAQGMPHLELGDVVTFTYVKLDGTQATLAVPILKHKFIFNGGFRSEFSASAPQQQTTSVTVTSGSSLADAVDVTYTDLADAIKSATQQITGNTGGYVTTVLDANNKPQELVISNTPNYNTADKVWRWNASGLGFSSTGYNGSMTVALTADGMINADAITTGTLTADRIKAGALQDKRGQSTINLNDGTFNFGNGKLVYDGSAFTINYTGTNLATDMALKADGSRLTPFESNISFANGIVTIGKAGNPFSVNITNQAMEFIDKGTTGGTLNLTAITGSGSAITCTYATQAVVPYQVGGYIQISGCSVSAYNGTWLVTSCTTTQVVATSTATGTVSSGFGVIQYGSSPNTVAYINGQKMYISNLQTTQTMQVGNHQITKYDANTTLVKFIG